MLRASVASPRVFRFLWIGVAVSYLMCGAALAGCGLLYVVVPRLALGLTYSVELLGVNVQRTVLPYMGWATVVIAFVHVYSLVNMITRSIRTRSLQFPRRGVPRFARRVIHALTTVLDSALPPRSSCLGFTLRSLGDMAVSLWNAFDVTSPNYGVVYFLREFIQTAIQTNQAYQLGAHVASPWMNNTIVFLLIVNCWAMPLIRYVFKIRSTPKARLLCLIVNFVLDFVLYIAFPIVLLVPYTKQFDYHILSFANEFWYTDAWIIQLKNEWPLILTTSVWDGLCRLFIIFGMTRTLRSIAKLLQPQETKPESKRGAAVAATPFPTTYVVPRRLSSSFASSLKHLPSVPVLRSRTEEWGHRVLGLWGLLVLFLHVQSACVKVNPLCLLQVRPWFVRRPVCSVMEINCYRSGQLTGNTSHFDAALDSIDSKWLSYLIIRHCPSVEITPRMQDLSWLMGIKIYNSTLVRWDENAALTETHHPNMLFVFFVCTNVSIFPQALYDENFPAKLNDIEFSFVNITEIPPEVADRWHDSMYLVMEGLQLPAFPDVLTKLQPSFLSLACNNFYSIPDAVFENPLLLAVILSDNPISTVPAGLDTLSSLFIVKTQIAQAPTWIDLSSGYFELVAGSTPLCDALAQRDSSVLGLSTVAEVELWTQRVNCMPADEQRYLSNYPLSEEDRINPSKTSAI